VKGATFEEPTSIHKLGGGIVLNDAEPLLDWQTRPDDEMTLQCDSFSIRVNRAMGAAYLGPHRLSADVTPNFIVVTMPSGKRLLINRQLMSYHLFSYDDGKTASGSCTEWK
jgi:hypothetical protein